jgi:SSS family solute:Na+ symporter
MAGRFEWLDWTVLAVYLVGTSWLADRLAGRKQTIRDFFLGGRSLPWPAVCGSIVASEVSGVTFVGVPAIAFAAGGDYRFLMLSIGMIVARFVIGYGFVPAFYRHEIYSPYEFMGRRLGPTVDRVATLLFFVGGFLAQGARLFLAGLVLDAITGMGLAASVLLLGAISVVWTWMGGIASVVWTDVVQFAILFVGGIVALAAVILVVPGGWDGIVSAGREAGKFRLWDFTLDRTTDFTLWTGLFGASFLTMASHGTDQMMAQRLFCCRDAASARKAVVWSGVSQVLPVLMLTVGVGIFAYFRQHPMDAEEAALMAKDDDYLLPIFILKAMPIGVKGLLFAAIFSAATATSTLAAMAQTALSAFYLPWAKNREERHLVRVSRVLVLAAAAGLCGTAMLCSLIREQAILTLALAMAGYTYGAMLGMLLLALLPVRRDARGLAWSVPLSMLLVFALNWQHESWGRGLVWAGLLVLASSAVFSLRREPLLLLAVWAAAFVVFAVATFPIGTAPDGSAVWFKLAFPWHYPLGAALTLGLGLLVGRKTLAAPEAASVSSGR